LPNFFGKLLKLCVFFRKFAAYSHKLKFFLGMSNLSLFEKLELKDEKNLLVQGLPSSIEKQFVKLSYAKNVTPLLKTKKIDFALVFAVNQNQLNSIMKEVFTALHEESKLWVAYPKQTSKIVSDLNRDCSWEIFSQNNYEGISLITLDHVWSAMRFKKGSVIVNSKVKPSEKSNAIEEEDKKSTTSRTRKVVRATEKS
jgi:hypothetical protein